MVKRREGFWQWYLGGIRGLFRLKHFILLAWLLGILFFMAVGITGLAMLFVGGAQVLLPGSISGPGVFLWPIFPIACMIAGVTGMAWCLFTMDSRDDC